jgi:hypothetical protein
MANTTRTREARPVSREHENREVTARKKQWAPASLLPEPDPQDGVSFRWVRKSMLGTNDPTNFSRKVREGWETCRIEDHPEMKLHVDQEAQNSGLVEIGGLILCKMPSEMVDQRNDYYRNRSEAQVESVDNNFMRENDPRMPLFKDKQSKVRFGQGS